MTVRVVVDASAAAAWLISSQATAAGDAFQQQSAGRSFSAPFCFRGEIRGVILRSERRRLLTPRSADADLAVLESKMDIERAADDIAEFAHWATVIEVARREGLSAFDAAYLELAQRLGAELASRDAKLIDAAQRTGIAVHDLR